MSGTNLLPSDTRFHGIVPGNPEIPLGRIILVVVFETPENFRKEKIEFEALDWPSQYHGIYGRPAYSQFMAVSHHIYLILEIPRLNEVITFKGNFAQSNMCDRDFHKIS
jgi:hypothetical protein